LIPYREKGKMGQSSIRKKSLIWSVILAAETLPAVTRGRHLLRIRRVLCISNSLTGYFSVMTTGWVGLVKYIPEETIGEG